MSDPGEQTLDGGLPELFGVVELDSRQCAEVALYMYQQWQEAMQPPLFCYYNFDDWLQRLIAKENS